MKILVTGGLGYIGSHTCVELLDAGYDIVVVDNLYNSDISVKDRIEKITGKTFKFYENDVCDEDALEKIFSENKIDAVIHFAAYKAVGESVKLPLNYYENNLTSTIKLCKVMKRHKVNAFVFSSSATVYGSPKTLPIKEDFPLSTTNPYGSTKLYNEGILKDVSISDDKFSVIILRYFNPIGAHHSALIGEDPKGIPNNLMPYIVKVAAGELECLNVFGNDYNTHDGTGVRDYIHVVDLAKGHLSALDKLDKEGKGLYIYNLGTGKGYSVLDMVHSFEEITGHKVPYKIAPRRPGDIATCYSDPTKAKDELDWEAHKGIKEMCEDSWNFIQKNK